MSNLTNDELLQLALDTRLYRFQATAGDPVQYEMTEAQLFAFARAVSTRARPKALAAMQGALPWPCLLGDFIGNGVLEDLRHHGVPLGPMGRCNAIHQLRQAIDEELL